MLSGAALQKKLSNSIHVFATTEAVGELTTLEALNKLIELYPNYPDPACNERGQPLPNPTPDSYPNREEKRLELLRRRLRNILAAETQSMKLLCDKAFELQMLLARGFPINRADIITLDEFEKNDELIFFSSGTVFEKASAKNFFNSAISRNGDGFIDLNRDPLSGRELASLAAQGLETFLPLEEQTPITYSGWGKKIGRILGSLIVISLFAFLLAGAFFPPLFGFPLAVMTACALYASSDLDSSLLIRMSGAAAGLTIFAALASLIFPPVLALFATSSLISSSAAAAAISFAQTVGIAFVMPAIMIGAAALRSIISRDINFYDALYKITNFPSAVITTVCSTLGGMIGKGVQLISDYFHPPEPQLAELLMPASSAEPVVVHNNSNALINNSLAIDAAAPRREIMAVAAPQEGPHENEISGGEDSFVCSLGDTPIEALYNNAFTMMRHA